MKRLSTQKSIGEKFLFYVFYVDNNSILYYSSFTKSTREKNMKPFETKNGNWKSVQAVFRCYKGSQFMDVTETLTIRATETSYQTEIDSTKQFLEKKYHQVVFRHFL